jgi:hypothetical protein
MRLDAVASEGLFLVRPRTSAEPGGLYRSRPSELTKRWTEPMTILAFVAGFLLGGKAGLLLAPYLRGMGNSKAD